MRSQIIILLEKELDIIIHEKVILESLLLLIPYEEFEPYETTIRRQDINSKLFWMGVLHSKIKNDIVEISELSIKINAINID